VGGGVVLDGVVVSGGVVLGGDVLGGGVVASGGEGSGVDTGVVGDSVSSGADVRVAVQPAPSTTAANATVAVRAVNRLRALDDLAVG
jgi:hypothetical protein